VPLREAVFPARALSSFLVFFVFSAPACLPQNFGEAANPPARGLFLKSEEADLSRPRLDPKIIKFVSGVFLFFPSG
jgi:hypothetical protein